MYIFNSFNYVPLKSVVIDALKAKGVKYKLPKKTKDETNISVPNFGPQVFQTNLSSLAKTSVVVKNGQATVEVPEFLVEACVIVENKLNHEGIFRKGGSAAKQRELKQLINSGKHIDDSYHVIDICNLIKLFFRELPEPLLPYYSHEMLLSCLLCTEESIQKETLLLSCLLLPIEHLAVLTYFMEFLAKASRYSESNRMDAKNLAIVLTPSLMPIDSKAKIRNNLNINHHIAVIEMLINCAKDIGSVPAAMAAKAAFSRTKKRRSASITRMFTGIKRMVGRVPSPKADTPGTSSDENVSRKRKSSEFMPPAVTIKRRREVAETTPRLCRMGGYSQSSLRLSDNYLLEKLQSSPERRKSEGATNNIGDGVEENEERNKKGQSKKTGLKTSKSTSNLLMSKKKNLERKLSNMTWRKRRSSPREKKSPKVNGKSEELVTISKKEYEDMKTRVSSMEKLLEEKEKEDINLNPRISLESEQLAFKLNNDLRLNVHVPQSPAAATDENTTVAVQEAFERVVEQSEQLAPQLSKDVRLRWSSDRQIGRSPSERKIGSIRRRSRELARSHSANAKTSLQRGRPNTRQTGLRSPRELSDPKRSKGIPQSPDRTKGKSGTSLPMSPGMRKLYGTPKRRDSILNIRRDNNGMVQAKARYFDSLNSSADETEKDNRSMEMRLQSVKAELGIQTRLPILKPALLPSVQVHKTPRSQAKPTPRSRMTPLKALPDVITTPRRSPRILARSAAQQL